jgi:hypothetical protein
MPNYKARLVKTVKFTGEHELGPHSDQASAEQDAEQAAEELNDAEAKDAPAVVWDIEDEDVEVEEVLQSEEDE